MLKTAGDVVDAWVQMNGVPQRIGEGFLRQ